MRGANRIRYPGSPHSKRCTLGVRARAWAPKRTREVCRLGSMPARVKLKGIDGGPHKRWSMWFNSMVREEPYLGLTYRGIMRRRMSAAMRPWTGAAWLSSARAARCLVKSSNERNPYRQLPARHGGDSGGTAGDKPEEGGDDVKSSWPLCPGLHTCYNGRDRAKRGREAGRSAEILP